MIHKFQVRLKALGVGRLMKMVGALCAHSDTALFKACKKGIYLLQTDFESMCCTELRLTSNLHANIIVQEDFTAKIRLDSLSRALRAAHRHKRSAVITAREKHSIVVHEMDHTGVHAMVGEGNIAHTHHVESTENRARVFHIMSKRQFQRARSVYACFELASAEMIRIVTSQVILSGTSGGIAKLSVSPGREEGDERAVIQFSVDGGIGTRGSTTIRVRKPHTSDFRLVSVPEAPFEIDYLLTYLKRSQALMAMVDSRVSVAMSTCGILISMSPADGCEVLVFTRDVSKDFDRDSYV